MQRYSDLTIIMDGAIPAIDGSDRRQVLSARDQSVLD
jgi:hypothetical protein